MIFNARCKYISLYIACTYSRNISSNIFYFTYYMSSTQKNNMVNQTLTGYNCSFKILQSI